MSMVEIHFCDLTPEAQKRVLKAAGIRGPEEANWDVFPVAILDYQTEGESHV